MPPGNKKPIKKKDKVVVDDEAYEVTGAPEQIDLGNGTMVTAPVGSYVMIYANGSQAVYTKAQFEDNFEFKP